MCRGKFASQGGEGPLGQEVLRQNCQAIGHGRTPPGRKRVILSAACPRAWHPVPTHRQAARGAATSWCDGHGNGTRGAGTRRAAMVRCVWRITQAIPADISRQGFRGSATAWWWTSAKYGDRWGSSCKVFAIKIDHKHDTLRRKVPGHFATASCALPTLTVLPLLLPSARHRRGCGVSAGCVVSGPRR